MLRKHDGGYVHGAMRFPGRPGVIAAIGTWSGGTWSPQSNMIVTQHRERRTIGLWHVVGVDIPARSRKSPALLLRPVGNEESLMRGDILTVGDAAFTEFDVTATNLPLSEHASVEVGPDALHGVAYVDAGRVSKLIIFHGLDDVLPREETHLVTWNDVNYSISIRMPPVESVELYLNGSHVTLARLLNTLHPVRGFVLGTGQEMLFRLPKASRGGFRAETKEFFEPTVSVASGSVRVILSQATPQRIPLFVSPSEPLRLLVSSLSEASSGNQRALLSALGQRVFSVNKFIGQLRAVSHAAATSGGELNVRVHGRREFSVRAAAVNWLDKLVSVREREARRVGELYAADFYRFWCKVLVRHEHGVEDWTLRFPDAALPLIREFMLSRVSVYFTTSAPDGVTIGAGTLIDISGA